MAKQSRIRDFIIAHALNEDYPSASQVKDNAGGILGYLDNELKADRPQFEWDLMEYSGKSQQQVRAAIVRFRETLKGHLDMVVDEPDFYEREWGLRPSQYYEKGARPGPWIERWPRGRNTL